MLIGNPVIVSMEEPIEEKKTVNAELLFQLMYNSPHYDKLIWNPISPPKEESTEMTTKEEDELSFEWIFNDDLLRKMIYYKRHRLISKELKKNIYRVSKEMNKKI